MSYKNVGCIYYQGYFEEISEETKKLMINYNKHGDLTEVANSYTANCIFMRQNKPRIIGKEGKCCMSNAHCTR